MQMLFLPFQNRLVLIRHRNIFQQFHNKTKLQMLRRLLASLRNNHKHTMLQKFVQLAFYLPMALGQ
jgi:hypothetical protein